MTAMALATTAHGTNDTAIIITLGILFIIGAVIAARAHARIPRALLRAPGDPLADARAVLTRPGPLGSVPIRIPNGS